ncbi:MAG: helix-turn-helix domain-containing protein [Pseudonocardiaceae bacterium]
MGFRPARHRYCRCGTHLAADNNELQCARCQRTSRDKLIAPPQMPTEFWQAEQLREAFTAQHIGRVARAYRTHPHHHAVYGPSGISQTLLGHWLGLRQPQISRIETGLPIRDLDTLVYWARVLRIPAELLWFDLPGQTRQPALDAEPLPAPPTPAQRVLLPAVVDGQSVLLRLESETLALGELSITSPADGSVSSEELLSAFDFDADELHHVAVALADSRRYLDGSVVEYFRRQLDACETDDGALGPAKVLLIPTGRSN